MFKTLLSNEWRKGDISFQITQTKDPNNWFFILIDFISVQCTVLLEATGSLWNKLFLCQLFQYLLTLSGSNLHILPEVGLKPMLKIYSIHSIHWSLVTALPTVIVSNQQHSTRSSCSWHSCISCELWHSHAGGTRQLHLLLHWKYFFLA